MSPSAHCFDDVYRTHFAFVWRSLKRLGVPDAALDDAVQDTFVVVHKRLAEFEGRSSVKTWLFAIMLRIARAHRRTHRRAVDRTGELTVEAAVYYATPEDSLEKAQAVRLVHSALDELDFDHREVFVMADLEQMTVPEISELLDLNLNTTYTRLRAARQNFKQALARRRLYRARTPMEPSSKADSDDRRES